MIEIVSSERCIECDICVNVCPRDVFDAVADGVPVIARKADCQTCFMCELYCPVDALYVSPYVETDEKLSIENLIETNRLGSYQRNMGWKKGKTGGTENDPTHLLRLRGGAG